MLSATPATSLTRGISPPTDSAARLFVLHTPRLGDRAGLGGAIEARRRFAAGRLQNALAAEYAATLRRYNRTLFTWEGMPGRVQYGDEWRPQDRFYGIGNGTPKQAIARGSTPASVFSRTGTRRLAASCCPSRAVPLPWQESKRS